MWFLLETYEMVFEIWGKKKTKIELTLNITGVFIHLFQLFFSFAPT
jgi:hypothetical protein